MKKNITGFTTIAAVIFVSVLQGQENQKGKNPVIFADARYVNYPHG